MLAEVSSQQITEWFAFFKIESEEQKIKSTAKNLVNKMRAENGK